MITKAPHFLLFSESVEPAPKPAASGTEACAAETNEPPRKWHFVLCASDGTTRLDESDVEREASSERLELLAIVRGLESLEQPSRVTLVTSSSWIRRSLRFGLDPWRENRWQWERYGRMAPVKNADLWQRIDHAMQFHDIECRTRESTASSDDLDGTSDPRPVHRIDGGHTPVRPPRVGSRARRRATWAARITRGLFSWCRMCRLGTRLVIASQ